MTSFSLARRFAHAHPFPCFFHSLQHLLTGLAAYLAITGCSCLCLAIKEPQAGYHVRYGFAGLPYVARGRQAQNGQAQSGERVKAENGHGHEVEWEVTRMDGDGSVAEGKKDV